MHRSLAILGAGGHGTVVADTAASSSLWNSIVFFDDQAKPGSEVVAWPVVGPIEQFFSEALEYTACVVGIGDNALRFDISNRLLRQNLPLETIVHPSAVVSDHCDIGTGSVVLSGAIINVGASLGISCVVNNNACINHDCVIESAVHIGPNASLGGGVHVGSRSWIGIGASVKHCTALGRDVIVGAGAAVVADIPDDKIVKGVPAV